MLIKLKDYERIYRIISAVLESENPDQQHSCISYSIFGAYIISQHYNVQPQIRCGLAAYYLTHEDDVLCFGEKTDRGVASGEDGFHCWVEVDGWAIDFMAPQFSKLINGNVKVDSKMFQKRLEAMVNDVNEMARPGDFFLRHSQDLAEEVLFPRCEHLGMQDLAKMCSEWFKKCPKKIHDSAASMDQKGNRRDIKLKSIYIRSRW